ncbi:chemotaxis-specific protein-glutamate methyltransferase CheB [uncultured Roseobacter sp.]|uniref:chemotaxis-specific protein-glutamate methyltransferase CheB n=1 Tax=uncultured Roseobacter sp. TaxID=114847 RepID=UPI0026163A86|nr:chemotaxis-specific protein-glutamate methyltransferase CheB [uncultured Roseobacter sp.]
MALSSYDSESTWRGAPKKVLIVDDSRTIRAWLRATLAADPRLEIVGEAEDAVAARDFLRASHADVLTLDIEMPGMSGLEFLTRLMKARPMPVVMMSSLTSAGSDAAIQALSRGAVDCMVKPSGAYGRELTDDICERVFQAACTTASRLRVQSSPLAATPAAKVSADTTPFRGCRRKTIFLIGASTGGVAALESVLPMLDPGGPPVVIVQHMPGNFLVSFSQRLDRHLKQNVCLAEEGMRLERGDIVLAPGAGQHTAIRRRNDAWVCHFEPNDPPALHCPAVDVLFQSAVSEARHVSAAILTGLGKDGAEGLRQLSEGGARTFGQNEDTCVVYGMPRAAKALGAVGRELPLDRIGTAMRESPQKKPARGEQHAGVPK